MQLPLAYLDATVVEEIPVNLWSEIFEATGWPESLVSKRDSFGHQDVLHAFAKDNPSDDLLQALETLHTLGTEGGREAIVSAMNDRRVAMDALPANMGEREFALRLYLAQRSDASLADVFARAQIQVQEGGDQRRYNEFMGRDARQITHLGVRKETLYGEILEYCRKSDLGDHVHVQAFEDDGTFVFNVLRSDRTRKPLAVVQGRAARATIEYRPVHGDILRYEASVGRLRIAARAASIVEFYRCVLGKVLFKDESFFDGAPVCNLKPLQERGRAALSDHGVFSVGRVWMTECLWERGDRNLLQIRSSDCFRSIEELRLPLTEGELLQAKLKLEVIGKSTRPVTVTIRVPSRIEVSRKSQEHLVEKVLNSIGIRNAVPSSSGSSLWSLRPWRHPIAVWRTVFGVSMDSLVESGVLTPIQLDSVTHPEHPDAGRTLAAHAVSDGDFYGVSAVPEIPSRSLSPTDIDGLVLVPEKLRLYLRSRLGISIGGTAWDEREILDLGVIRVGDHTLHIVYALRQPPHGIGDSFRARAAGAHLVLLIPSPQADSIELAKVMLDSPLPTRIQVVRSAINACGLVNSVPAIYSAPDGARLVVDSQLKMVWIDGLEIGGLQPNSHPFRFIELMAGRSTPISSDEVSAILSPGRRDGNVSARQAKTQVKKIIVEGMAAHGRTFHDDPFPVAGSGFYRCALPSYVR